MSEPVDPTVFSSEYKKIMAPKEVGSVLRSMDSFAEMYYFKHSVARLLEVKSIVEFGVRAGYSAWAFLYGLPADTKYRGYDFYKHVHGGRPPNYMFKEHAEKLLKAYDASITLADTQKLHGKDLPQGFDLYHVDAHHGHKEALRDIEICFHAFGPNSAILVDDLTHVPSVASAVREFVKRQPQLHRIGFKSLRGDVLITQVDVLDKVKSDKTLNPLLCKYEGI